MVLSFPLFLYLSSPFLFLVCYKRELSCIYIKATVGSWFFEFFYGLSLIMTHAVATHPRSRTLHLHLLCGFLWTKRQALCFYGKALSMMEFLVDVFLRLLHADYRYMCINM